MIKRAEKILIDRNIKPLNNVYVKVICFISNQLIDLVGNSKEIKKEWEDITQNIKADIKVMDMPLLDTTQHKDTIGTFVSDLVLQVLAFVSERERDNILQRQAEGIAVAKAKGKHL